MLRKTMFVVLVSLLLTAMAFAQGSSSTATTTASTEKTTATVRFTPTKDQIKAGQEILIKLKLYTGEATGVYGESRPAIKAYQKANGLEETGRFDKATLAKMNIALTDKQKEAPAVATTPAASSTPATTKDAGEKAKSTDKTASTATDSAVAVSASTNDTDTGAAVTKGDGPKRPAPFQATKEQITQLQKVLTDAKLYTGEADGERSDALKEAVTSYQTANKLKATGGINAATLEKAGITLTDKQKEQVAAQAAYEAGKPKN